MTMADQDGVIWFDGELVPWREAKIHVLTHTLHYGTGVFEGMRAYATPNGAAIFRLHDHTLRMFRSAHILKMSLPYSADEINEACITVVRDNGLTEAYVRPHLFLRIRGYGLACGQPEGTRGGCCLGMGRIPGR